MNHKATAITLLVAGLAVAGCAKKGATEFVQDPGIKAQLKSFAAGKESQARTLAFADSEELPAEIRSFFSAVENDDWEVASNDYADMRSGSGSGNGARGSWWQPVLETFGAMKEFALGDDKYAAAFGNDIIHSIPPHSIYFGGTDPGRFIITAMEKSQIRGDPFFGLTQNTLTDESYLDYLRSMYGNQIYIPTAADSEKCFDDYYRNFPGRQARHELLPGETVTNGPDGKMRVNSQMSLMQIRASLARVIFEKNTNREIYIEESFPLEWMYPYLEPHGLIFKLNHERLDALSNDAIQRDRDYWTTAITPMIGDWLEEDTSVSDVAGFAEKVFLKHAFNGFAVDTNFVFSAYSHRMFSKERSSIAGLYSWRALHSTDAGDKRRMDAAADFAFRQAWALCPYSPEVVFRYVQFLVEQKRVSDALVVAETAAKFRDEAGTRNGQINMLVTQLKRYQRVRGNR